MKTNEPQEQIGGKMIKKGGIYKYIDLLMLLVFYITLVIVFLRPSCLKFSTPLGGVSLTSAKNVAILLSLIWLIAMLSNPRRYLTPCRLAPPLLLFVGVSIVSAILSPFGKPVERWEAILELALYCAFLYTCLYLFRTAAKRRTVLRLLFHIAVFVAAVDIVYHYRQGLWLILDQGYPFWDGKNALGLFMAMTLSLCTALIVSAPKSGGELEDKKCASTKRRNSLLFVGLFFIFLCLIYSYSRGAWLAMIGATLAFGLLRLWKLIALVAIAALLLVILPHRKASHRFRSIWRMRDGNVARRVVVWKDAIEMIQERPLLGVGPGEFRTAYIQSGTSARSAVKPDSPKERMRFFEHAHNLFLQVGAETGLAGLLALMWMFVVIVRAARHHLKTAQNLKQAKIFNAVIAALVAFLVFSLVDCSWTGRFSGSSFMHINLIVVLLLAMLLTEKEAET